MILSDLDGERFTGEVAFDSGEDGHFKPRSTWAEAQRPGGAGCVLQPGARGMGCESSWQGPDREALECLSVEISLGHWGAKDGY